MVLRPPLKPRPLMTDPGTGPELELAYPIRLPVSDKYTVVPESSETLNGAFTPFAIVPTPAADGLARARLTLGPKPQFIRLKVAIP